MAAYADGLKRANQQKDRILSIVSHELNTPITVILSQAQMLLRRLTKQPELPVDAVKVMADVFGVNPSPKKGAIL